MSSIRPFREADWSAVWSILEPVFRAGETYAFSPRITEAEARQVWIDHPQATYVAEDDAGQLAGTYYIKPNQPELGAHVCNCGYAVAENARGQGLGSRMCVHSLDVARDLGFRAMQYNLVAATNEGAIRVWEKHGFTVVGRLPGAFRHAGREYVDALIMHQWLD